MVTIRFVPPYSDIVGQAQLELELGRPEAAIKEVFATLLKKHQALEKRLQDRDLLRGGVPYALFMVEDQVVGPETRVADGAEIKVLFPLCGG